MEKSELESRIAALEQERDRLREALEWCAGHAYAGGKSFGDVRIVKAAQRTIRELEAERDTTEALIAVSVHYVLESLGQQEPKP